MKCPKCSCDFDAEHGVDHGGQLVCEDCVMDLMSPARACDPWAVKMATGSITSTAAAVAALKGDEKALYELIREKSRVPREALPELLDLPMPKVQRAFSVLRHMELLRGDKRDGGGMDIVLFEG